MPGFVPDVRLVDSIVRVRLSDGVPVRVAPFSCVVDLDQRGNPIGVEVLDFRRQTQSSMLKSRTVTKDFHWGYDLQIDALYIQIRSGTAPIQQTSSGLAFLDAKNDLVSIEVRLRDERS